MAALKKVDRTPRDAAPVAQPGEERSLEASLRPQRLSDDEYINQDKVKGQLRIVIEAAKARNETLEHIALYGPPASGKSHLAAVWADKAGAKIIEARSLGADIPDGALVVEHGRLEWVGPRAELPHNLRTGCELHHDCGGAVISKSQ